MPYQGQVLLMINSYRTQWADSEYVYGSRSKKSSQGLNFICYKLQYSYINYSHRLTVLGLVSWKSDVNQNIKWDVQSE